MHFRKGSSCFISIALLIFFLTGCTGQTQSSSTDKASSSGGSVTASSVSEQDTEQSYVTAAGSYPIVNEKIKLSVFTAATSQGTDFEYDKNKFTQWLTDKTNIDLEFVVVNSADAREKLRLSITGGDYPDILFRSGFSLAEQLLYGSQGILLPLNDLIDTYCIGIPQMFNQYPAAKDQYTLNDGNMYDVPSVNDCYHCSVTEKMWVYKPWLDQLGLALPTSTDEFYDMLIKFRDQDPNNNGKKDEVPLACSPKGWDSQVEGFLMQPFSKTKIYVENGTVKAGYVSDGWRDGLRYLKKLYAEKLLAPESLTQDGEQLKQLGSMPTHILGAAPGGYEGTFTTFDEEGDWKNWVTIPSLKGPSGRQESSYSPYGNFFPSFSITNKCQYPEAAIRLADCLVEQETTLRLWQGVLGEDWDWVTDKKLLGINDQPAVYKTNFDRDPPKNQGWGEVGLALRTSDMRLGRLADETTAMETILYLESQKNYYPYIPASEELFPPMAYSEADSMELASYESPIDTYVQEMTARFITGESNIDADTDWNGYLSELENIGLSRMIEIYQATYNAKYK